jgi:hypothetical protein
MGLTDLVVFLVAASLAHRAYPPKPRPDGNHTMTTLELKQNQDQMLRSMSSPSTVRGNNPAAREGPKVRQQQQERPTTGQKRRAQEPIDAPSVKRRPSASVPTPSTPREKTSLPVRLLQCLKVQSFDVIPHFCINDLARLASTLNTPTNSAQPTSYLADTLAFLLHTFQSRTHKQIDLDVLNIILVQDKGAGWLSLLPFGGFSLRVVIGSNVIIKGDLMSSRRTALFGLRNTVEKLAAIG